MLAFGFLSVLLVLFVNFLQPVDCIVIASAHTHLLAIGFLPSLPFFLVELKQGFPQLESFLIFIHFLMFFLLDILLIDFPEMFLQFLVIFLLLFLNFLKISLNLLIFLHNLLIHRLPILLILDFQFLVQIILIFRFLNGITDVLFTI